MPATTITTEEQKWAEKVYSHLNWSFPDQDIHIPESLTTAENDDDDTGLKRLSGELSALEDAIMRLSGLEELAKGYKPTASIFKKSRKSAETNLKAAKTAQANNNVKLLEAKILALRANTLELDGAVEIAEKEFKSVTEDVTKLKQHHSQLEAHKAELLKRAMFQKVLASKFKNYETHLAEVAKQIDAIDLSVSLQDIDHTAKAVKSAQKHLQKLEKDVQWFDEYAETPKPAKTLSEDKLKSKIASDYSKKKESWRPMVCYNTALKVGVLEGNLSDHFHKCLMSKKLVQGYPEGYAELMDVSAETVAKTFDHNEIGESGLINFWDDHTEKVSHTAYLQKTEDGDLHIYHTNCLPLDRALMGNAIEAPQTGGLTHYNLSNQETQGYLQNWLNGGYSFKVTPASELNK